MSGVLLQQYPAAVEFGAQNTDSSDRTSVAADVISFGRHGARTVSGSYLTPKGSTPAFHLRR
jgi:hypothetical protein